MPGDIVPVSTACEPNQSTRTTEAKMVKMAKKVSTARASVEARAASNAASTAREKRPVTSASLVNDCSVRTEDICSLA